ncbi:MAG: DUF3575 domain-containing protein [Lutibacter sp.]|uniref:DUF3575 domain-containing protein n=1 Tax=Lutibacter sp. TaxID=1925666 RepID=UPI0019E2105C|nr:DUF3575 domain-containing protein [Lutibacter sp.]NOR27940.1 DUF3575 domain-containing protein [Lutibacter sp.]
MKKILLSVILVVASLSTFAQENEMGNNELKINMSNLIGFKFLDVGYEKILNEESAFGVNVLFNIDKKDPNDNSGLDEYRTFSITPYYRHFFSNKYASGFFVEVFTMLHSGEEDLIVGYADFPPYTDIYNTEKYTDFAVGISAGAKFVSKRGFVAEIYLGIGRDLIDNHDFEIVGRGGVSIGYRF